MVAFAMADLEDSFTFQGCTMTWHADRIRPIVGFVRTIVFGLGWVNSAWIAPAMAQSAARDANAAASQRASDSAEDGFQPLFDGSTFEGWEGNRQWFRIESGEVVAGSLERAIPHNEFLCTERKYGDFELKLDVKLVGEGDNAGVQFRTVRLPDSTEVSGYQCDVGSAWGRPVWGGLYDESRRNKMLAEGAPQRVAAALKPGDWNKLMVRAIGNHIQIWLNGTLTVEFTETDPAIAREGVIALQIHSGPPTEARYRNIRIRPLN
jgi:hypothetical protein